MIEIKYRMTLVSAAFVHSVMHFCNPVTHSGVSNALTTEVSWYIESYLSGYEGSSVVPYTLYHFHGAI